MSGAAQTAAAARSLYRDLWRRARELPLSVQVHYRGAIRSGFVSHADEDDEEVLARIRSQALLDADWLVNKYKAEKEAEQQRRPKAR
ncbi:LYR motif-containing 9 [Chlorella sorokiniana]|jgi:hypothetical protein|uniref:LYR motif-containing protein 9 n=1 Tax=Chlorella sorokiniana TaxID=3076 RepID=A0A2P6TYU3_CHLSO|nr:LYR motif-containing 9 [Chlorella sorokiniana]|eukprot:PRW59247.1 LYR motif-containing 9 [Chlorella sorokiniana]